MTDIEHLLRERIGLDAASVGPSLIGRTVRLRMKALGLKRPEDYKRLLRSSSREWAELVESVVVTETWFFRDREMLAAFARLAVEEGLPAHPVSPLRVLSVPCSSGEEPYSAAIALLEAGVPPERFRIDAVDISARAVAKAKRGIYGRNSFRGADLDFRDRFFRHTKEGFVLNRNVRRCVQFLCANLLSDEYPVQRGPYDFILCRNLLIYFDRATQQRALETIDGLLLPSGALFVGPAELPLVIDRGFVSANIPMAFACRKAGHPMSRPTLPNRPAKLVTPTAICTAPPPPSQPQRESTREPSPLPAPELSPVMDTDLDYARRLADAGRLDEAAMLCEAHLRKSRASAQAWYLLGLVRDAAGDETAIDHYRKALYLEPNHYETLRQMALLAQKKGDLARARTFRRRAERIRSRV